MNTNDDKLSINTVYLRLNEIIKNDVQEPLDRVGSYIVGCTLAIEGIERLFESYPTLEEIADIGSDVEYQGEEYFDEYHYKLTKLLEKLAAEIGD
jgi:hypothetical protein